MNTNIDDIDPRMNEGAVSVYENNTTDEFPVLKAFQQYIDAEQAKARKRMMLLGVFFGFVLTIVIAVFVILLVNVNARNQSLNDRLVEFAMKDRDRGGPVVVQPSQDNSAFLSLASKIEEMKKALSEREQTQETVTPPRQTKSDGPSAAELEISRLKALLAVEKEKASAEREKQRQRELEAYRRQHYPELYGLKPIKTEKSRRKVLQEEDEAVDREIESIINDIQPVSYFDDEEVEEEPVRTSAKSSKAVKEKAAPSKDGFRIPVDVKDSSGKSWSIPMD